jgi:hypothetical protein
MSEYNKQHSAVAIKSWKTALRHPKFRRAVRKRFSRAEEKCRKANPSILATRFQRPRSHMSPPPLPLSGVGPQDTRGLAMKCRKKKRPGSRCGAVEHTWTAETALRRACPKTSSAEGSQMLESASVKNSQRCRPETDVFGTHTPNLGKSVVRGPQVPPEDIRSKMSKRKAFKSKSRWLSVVHGVHSSLFLITPQGFRSA